jgi:alpha-L-fucosidase 2
MGKLALIISTLFLGIFFSGTTSPVHAQAFIPARGVSSSVPATRWDYGFLTGNGRIGAVVYGQPSDETIVFNHARLYLPQPRPPLVDLGKYIPDVHRIIREEGFEAAQDFIMEQATLQGHFNYHSDPFHYAFELKLEMPANGSVKDYLRTTDFETGEVVVNWRDDTGRYLRRLFVSRPDNVAVLSVKSPDSGKISLSIIPTPVKHQDINSEISVGREWISYHNSYRYSQGGYDNVVRVLVKGGHSECDGHKIIVSDADEVLLLTRVEWYGTLKEGSVQAMKESLSHLPADYQLLLKPHVAEHKEIFDRVTLDLGGGEDHRLTSEKLLERAKATDYKNIPAALLEKMYDASRFYFICSAGELPPNLQGIWNGEFTAPWSGSFTFDTNVQTAMDAALSGNMAEGMEGFFRMIETFLPDWRINAQKLYGARGILGQIVASPNTGLHYHFARSWAWNFWTPGAGWLASYFYDYYRFTGDKAFLANRAVPLMKEIALFYEDFLTEKDATGHYLYRPSISPEVRSEKAEGLLISDNSTIDLAVARELLTNLIAAGEELRIEKENVVKWRTMLGNLPPYQIGPDGDLAEWSDGSFRHMYNHRHHSPFYPIFRSFEFSPEATPELWEASKVALKKKGDQWLRNPKADNEGIPFGRAFHAQCAAYLGQAELVEEVVNSMADRVYPSLFMSLGPNGKIFNFDGNGAFPDIINRSVAFSLNGTLDLLRSMPPGWNEGSISGILVRGQIRIERLRWNQTKGVVELELISAVNQKITLRMPVNRSISSIKITKGEAAIENSETGPNARKVTLPAGSKVKMEIHFDTERKEL